MQGQIVYVGISMVSVQSGSKEYDLPIGEWHKKAHAPKIGQTVEIERDAHNQRWLLK